MSRPVTPLVESLRARIVELLRQDGAVDGTRLVERALAERLGVSRTPVRSALALLAQDGVVRRDDTGRPGYVLAGDVLTGDTTAAASAPGSVGAGRLDEAYLAIATDRLDGVLDDRITERALMRRYGLTSAQVTEVCRRISEEGWGEPAPGYGWRFRDVLTSPESYAHSHRFRAVVEPAALLEPGYRVDVAALTARRAEQAALADGGVREVSVPELFDLNSRFHETLVAGCGNPFLVDSVARVNRLRRLLEYRKTLEPDRARVRCTEHVELADLVVAGRLREASEFLAGHLGSVAAEKQGNG
ncbi:GntR family transcriptional regulator [Corynebacterium sp.]|uniref:GntR family transcriptional regulator n=1 Tax=Corynebacterium sp. TaxID=1720 RepID=UPI003B3A1B94